MQRLGELAALIGGTLVGEPDTVITGVGEMDSAEPGQITYAVNRKYLARAGRSRASAFVVGLDVETFDRPHIKVRLPYLAFARILDHFRPRRAREGPAVHPLAAVSPGAVLAGDVRVGAFTVVESGCRIGAGTDIGSGCYLGHDVEIGGDARLHPGAIVLERCRLGDRVILHPGTVVGSDGYGFVTDGPVHHKIPQIGIVVIGDDVEVGAGSTIDRATIGATVIGPGTKIDNLVQIGHNCQIGARCLIVAQAGLSGSTTLEDDCRVAGQAGTTGHLTVGRGSTIAARGVPTHDVAPGSFVSGFPARPHREELRIQATLSQLPELLRRVRLLESRLEELAAGTSTPTPAGGSGA